MLLGFDHRQLPCLYLVNCYRVGVVNFSGGLSSFSIDYEMVPLLCESGADGKLAGVEGGDLVLLIGFKSLSRISFD